jgi:hypothetical protein
MMMIPVTPANWLAALRACKGGETLVFGPEPLGDVFVSKSKGTFQFDLPVTLDLSQATIEGRVAFGDVRGLRVVGGVFLQRVKVERGRDMAFEGCRWVRAAGIQAIDCTGLKMDRLRVQDAGAGIALQRTSDYSLTNSQFTRIRGNAFFAKGGSRGLIARCVFHMDVTSDGHPDCAQFADDGGVYPSDIEIIDSVMLGKGQGAFFGNGGPYSRIGVRRCEITTTFKNGIYLATGDETCEVEDNRLSRYPGGAADPTLILSPKVRVIGENVARGATLAATA